MLNCDWKTIEIHPHARWVERPSPEDYKRLRDSIARDGQLMPILVYQGYVIDGRTRLEICRELNVVPHFEAYEIPEGKTVAEVVHSMASERRHWTQAQIATAAAQMFEAMQKEMASDIQAGTARPISVEAAAKAAGVSRTTMRRALRPEKAKEEAAARAEKQARRRPEPEPLPDEPDDLPAPPEPDQEPQRPNPPPDDRGGVKDGRGFRVLKRNEKVFQDSNWKPLIQLIRQAKSRAKDFAETESGRLLHLQSLTIELDNAADKIKLSVPYSECPLCGGKGCARCGNLGWITKIHYEQIADAIKEDFDRKRGATW